MGRNALVLLAALACAPGRSTRLLAPASTPTPSKERSVAEHVGDVAAPVSAIESVTIESVEADEESPHLMEGVAGVVELRPITDAAWLAAADRAAHRFPFTVAMLYPRFEGAALIDAAPDHFPPEMKAEFLRVAVDVDGDDDAEALVFEYCVPDTDEARIEPLHDECDVSGIELHVRRDGSWHRTMRWHQF